MSTTHKTYAALGLSLLAAFLVPFFATAEEIRYHSVTSVRGDDALVLSHTPSGDTNYRCSLQTGECEKADRDDMTFFTPTVTGRPIAEMSDSGTYGVAQQVVNLGTTPVIFYSFYNLSGETPVFAGLVSVSGVVTRTAFSPDEGTYLMVTNEGVVTSYTIKTKEKHSITLDQADLPYFAVSNHGTYVSAYNYLTESHKIWNTKTGSLVTALGEPSVVEYSEDESEAAYIAEINGYRNLKTISLPSGETHTAASGKFLVEDFVYLDTTLYYLANKKEPLIWSLYNADTGEVIADDVSYNVYLTRYGDKIVYGKIVEKNTDLYVYDGDTSTRLQAAPVSYRASDLTRETTTYDGKTAAVIMPEEISRGDLYIWLHGGPRRQTSLGYHPYLSYAVYDELLENLAAAGNYVVKLDYTGSWGYGEDFMTALNMKVGVVEIDDVKKTIDAFKRDHRVQNVYLIGNSYGGYMAFRGLNALTDDIDGIIAINGVADWYGLVQQIPSSPFADLFGGVPSLSTLPLYLSASAFTNTKDINGRDMLIIYGSEDKTVPPGQSKQYAEFMEANEKDPVLIELTGAEHVITRRENITEMCEAIQDIFEDDLECTD